MKITKKRLREIIKEELEEAAKPTLSEGLYKKLPSALLKKFHWQIEEPRRKEHEADNESPHYLGSLADPDFDPEDPPDYGPQSLSTALLPQDISVPRRLGPITLKAGWYVVRSGWPSDGAVPEMGPFESEEEAHAAGLDHPELQQDREDNINLNEKALKKLLSLN